MIGVTVRAPEPSDLKAIQLLVCGSPGAASGPLRGLRPNAAGVAAMVQRAIVPLVLVDSAGAVRSYISGYGLDPVAEESVFLSVCSDDQAKGTPLAVLGVAEWVQAARRHYPLARVFVEGPASRFESERPTRVLEGPLVRRQGVWWNGSRFEDYQLWEIDRSAAVSIASDILAPATSGSRVATMTLAQFHQELVRCPDVGPDPEVSLDLDSLGLVELLSVITELAGLPSSEEDLSMSVVTVADAYDAYLRLSDRAEQ